MKKGEFIREVLLGGPGLDGYAYQADTYCVSCAEDIVTEIADTVAPKLSGTDDPLYSDTETVPQPIFFGESDYDTFCSSCGELLYNGLHEESEETQEYDEQEV